MRAVTGSVVSSRPISLSKASAVLARFAANENAARPEVAAYVRRASAAFDELVRFHREIRAARKRPELEKLLEVEKEVRRKEKRRKRSRDEPDTGPGDDGVPRAGADGEVGEDANLVDGDGNRPGGRAEVGSHGERKKRRKKANDEERSQLAVKLEKNVVSPGNLVGKELHCEDGAELIDDGKRRKKTMITGEETSSLGRKGENKLEAEDERHKHRKKKKKEKEKHKGHQQEEVVVEVLNRKHRKHSDIGEELDELKDQKEHRKKKKKKHNRLED